MVAIDQDNNFILNGRPFFPLGMNPGPEPDTLWRDGTSAWAELARGGINFFRTCHHHSTWTADDEQVFIQQMQKAEQYGLYGYVALRDLSVPLPEYPDREINLRRVISTYKDGPVLFWKDADEPCWGGVSIPGLIDGYNIIKELDPDHPVLMNHAPRNEVDELRQYCVACDSTGCDIYPVSIPMGKNSRLPNTEISVVGDYTLRMRDVVYDQKPIVMVLQITWSGVLPPYEMIRPTFYQQRYMTYQAIIDGAKGLAWFGSLTGLNEEDAPYGWNWTYWVDVIKPLLEEIKAGSELNRVICAPTHDPVLGVAGASDVEYLARLLDGRLYLLGSKRESATANVSFSGLPANAEAEALFENRAPLSITNGTLTDSYDADAIHVYRIYDPVMESNYDQDTVSDPGAGTYPLPQGWSLSSALTNPDRCGVVESGTEFAPEPAEPTLARCVKFHDPAGSTGNAQLYRSFPAATTGVVTARFDVRLSQTNSAFLCRLTNSGSVSNYSSFATHLVFEGATPWASDGAPGTISYETERNAIKWVNSGATYEPNKWYTVRIEANMDTAKFRIYFGPRSRPLTEITPYDGVPFIVNAATGEHVTDVQKICFGTSSLTTDAEGVAYIDNVRIEGPVQMPEPQNNVVSQARTAPKGSAVQLNGAIVTGGTDQLGRPFFYVQDDAPGGAGLRVRMSGVTVHEGDRVNVAGTMAQVTDNGIAVRNNGEREIAASQVTVIGTGATTPPPVYLRNSSVGGGFFGEMEYVDSTYGYWPQLKGVWPYSQFGNGKAQYSLSPNSYSPLFNVGTLVTVSGRVTKMCKDFASGHTDNDFYIDDGTVTHDGWYDPDAYGGDEADHPRGIRIRMPVDITALPGYGDITGAYVSVTGIAGAISASDIVSNSGIRNVALVRVRNAARDIKIIEPAGSPSDRRFDVITFSCPGAPDKHVCQGQFDALNWVSGNGHYLAMGSSAHKSEVDGSANNLAVYYNSLNDNWTTVTGAGRADEIWSWCQQQFTDGGIPQWIVVNEISASQWQNSQTYRTWVADVVERLHNTYGFAIILCAPFATPGENDSDWQAVSAYANIGAECYLSGQEINSSGNSISWCQSQYQSTMDHYAARGVPASKVFLVEHFGQTVSGANWGRAGVSYADWDSAIHARCVAAHNVGFAGFVSYGWGSDDMLASDADMIHFEQTYSQETLP